MPKELPGLYWDEEKNRYFPLAMKPKLPTGHTVTADPPRTSSGLERSSVSEEDKDGPFRKRRRIEGGIPTFHALDRLRSSVGPASRRRSRHDIATSSLSLSCGGAAYSVARNAELTSFCTERISDNALGSYSVMLGDNRGWLYSINDFSLDEVVTCQEELNIGSSVSAICSSGTRRVAASFGWPCKIFICEAEPTERWTILSMPDVVCHDVSTAHLQNSTLALGAGGRGILVPDIERGNSLQVLETGSDVLSISLDNHLVYAGARNGFVSRFDTRLTTKNRQELLDGRFQRSRSSVTHLSVIHQWELLLSTIRGDLETHDLRYMREGEPLLKLAGHVNTSATRLGLAIDPSEDFVFAGGQDHRVRGWSLRTGRQVPSHPINSRAPVSMWHDAPTQQTRLFDVLFDHPVTAMNVAADDVNSCLWAACGGDFYRIPLGSVANNS